MPSNSRNGPDSILGSAVRGLSAGGAKQSTERQVPAAVVPALVSSSAKKATCDSLTQFVDKEIVVDRIRLGFIKLKIYF